MKEKIEAVGKRKQKSSQLILPFSTLPIKTSRIAIMEIKGKPLTSNVSAVLYELP